MTQKGFCKSAAKQGITKGYPVTSIPMYAFTAKSQYKVQLKGIP